MWHVSHGDKNFGPFTEDKMLALIKAGKLPPTVHVWKEGMAEWVLLRDSSLMKTPAAVAPVAAAPVVAAPVMATVVTPVAPANPFDFSKPAATNQHPGVGINVAPQPTAQQLANPYFSDFNGSSAAAKPAAAAADPNFRFLPLAGRQSVVIVTTAIAGILSLVTAWVTFQQINLISRMAGGSFGNNRSRALAEANASDQMFLIVFLSLMASLLAMSIAFLVWFYRAHVNAKAMASFKFSDTSGWAVGYFFIPILNLFKPYISMRDIWRGSFSAPGSFAAPSAGFVGIWWFSWIAMNFLNRPVIFMFGSEHPRPDELIALSNVAMICNVAMLVPLGLTIMLVIQVTKQQARKAKQISQGIGGQPQPQKAQPQFQMPQL